MVKTNFWNDAAKYGAIVGIVSALFQTLQIAWTQATWLSIVSFVVSITLMFLFTKKRAIQYGGGAEGFSYGQGLKFSVCMLLLAGIVSGAWDIVLRQVLFTPKYEELLNTTLATMANAYPADMFDMVSSMSRKMMFSPLWIALSAVIGSAFKGFFFGLFIAAFTQRKPDVFNDANN